MLQATAADSGRRVPGQTLAIVRLLHALLPADSKSAPKHCNKSIAGSPARPVWRIRIRPGPDIDQGVAMNTHANSLRHPAGSASATTGTNTIFSTSLLHAGNARPQLFMLAAFSLAVLLSASTAYALPPIKQKTTGSHIVRSVEKDAGDEVQLEPVEVMIGAVLDAREAAREARDEPSALPDLPVLGSDAFLDDAAMAVTGPKR